MLRFARALQLVAALVVLVLALGQLHTARAADPSPTATPVPPGIITIVEHASSLPSCQTLGGTLGAGCSFHFTTPGGNTPLAFGLAAGDSRQSTTCFNTSTTNGTCLQLPPGEYRFTQDIVPAGYNLATSYCTSDQRPGVRFGGIGNVTGGSTVVVELRSRENVTCTFSNDVTPTPVPTATASPLPTATPAPQPTPIPIFPCIGGGVTVYPQPCPQPATPVVQQIVQAIPPAAATAAPAATAAQVSASFRIAPPNTGDGGLLGLLASSGPRSLVASAHAVSLRFFNWPLWRPADWGDGDDSGAAGSDWCGW